MTRRLNITMANGASSTGAASSGPLIQTDSLPLCPRTGVYPLDCVYRCTHTNRVNEHRASETDGGELMSARRSEGEICGRVDRLPPARLLLSASRPGRMAPFKMDLAPNTSTSICAKRYGMGTSGKGTVSARMTSQSRWVSAGLRSAKPCDDCRPGASWISVQGAAWVSSS